MNKNRASTNLLAKDFELTPLEIGEPHSKTFLTTRLGRIVDSASYPVILLFAFLILEYSTLYFYLSPEKDGISLKTGDGASQLINAIYFSVVTFTSLGYGDITPHGLGKLVSATVVLFGLILVALLIGKIASERQFSISLLLYTSDCQRRLIGFCGDLKRITKELKENVHNSNSRFVNDSIGEMQQLLEAISKYVTFQAHQARLAHFGNGSALKALYEEMYTAQKTCSQAFQSPLTDEGSGKRCIRLVVKITNITTLLILFQNSSEDRKRDKNDQQAAEVVSMQKIVSDLQEWACTHISPWLLSKVIPLTPIDKLENWGKNLHSDIAKELGISKKLARRCIEELIKQQKVPRKFLPSKIHVEESILSDDLFRILNALNRNTLHLQQLIFTGREVMPCLDKISATLIQIENKIASKSVNPGIFKHYQINQSLQQLKRMQASIFDIVNLAAFNETEKNKANVVAYEISRLAYRIFEVSYDINPISIRFHFLNIFNENNKYFHADHLQYLKNLKQLPPKMTLRELFALSSKS